MGDIAVKIKQMHGNAIIPKYQTPGSAGMDLHAVEDMEVWVGEAKVVPTGIGISVPPGHEAQIRPRSGLAANRQVTVLNSPGTIDSDYTGQLFVSTWNRGNAPFVINPMERLAQLVVIPVAQVAFNVVDEFGASDRGVGGFGSTGKS